MGNVTKYSFEREMMPADLSEHLSVSMSALAARKAAVWDSLWERKPIDRIAVAVTPSEDTLARAKEEIKRFDLPELEFRPPLWTEKWRENILENLASLYGGLQMPGDAFLSLAVPRFVHGQSQGICDIYGAKVEPQPDGNIFAYPLAPDPKRIEELEPKPVAASMYWGAVEYVRYALAATGGRFPFRNPVMTGPLDTANYLLGTTVLMEWVYTEPRAVHRLLDKVTGVLIETLRALREAANGDMHGDIFACTRGGLCVCSECRSIISREIFEEFEAPYLRRMGDELGPYGIHSCGSWERTIPSAKADPHLRFMHGQVQENDLADLCELADGKILLAIGPSINVHERYIWPDKKSFFSYILRTVPRSQPLEVTILEEEVPLWNNLCEKHNAAWNRIEQPWARKRRHNFRY